jgi:protein involved in polysaccharide export with SLBB domain
MPRRSFLPGSIVFLVMLLCLSPLSRRLTECRAQTPAVAGSSTYPAPANTGPTSTAVDTSQAQPGGEPGNDQNGLPSTGPPESGYSNRLQPPTEPAEGVARQYPEGQQNPLIDSQNAKLVFPGRRRVDQLPDYRSEDNPEQQRRQLLQRPLPLYGFDFFASAREIIEARRYALRRLLSTSVEAAAQTSRPVPRRINLGPDLSISLTDTEKTDLTTRLTQGELTTTEKLEYRSFLYPQDYDADGNPRNPAYDPLAQLLQATGGETEISPMSPGQGVEPTSTTPTQTAPELNPAPSGAEQPQNPYQAGSPYVYVPPPSPAEEEQQPVYGAPGSGAEQPAYGSAESGVEQPSYGEEGSGAQEPYYGPEGSAVDQGAGTYQQPSDNSEDIGPGYTLPNTPDNELPYGPDYSNIGPNSYSDQVGPNSDSGSLTPYGGDYSLPNSDQTGIPDQTDQYASPAQNGEYYSSPDASYNDYGAGQDQGAYNYQGGGAYGAGGAYGSPDQGAYNSGIAGMTGAPYGATAPMSQAPYGSQPTAGDAYFDNTVTREQPPYQAPVNAYDQIADPLATTLQQVVASAPTNYQLSGGDQIILRYSSPTMEERRYKLRLDSSGALDVPEVGHVVVRGDTVAQAEDTLRAKMSPIYRNVDVSVELGPLRTIPVTVSGESFFPGTYQVSAVATAFNMVYATGGPTQDGSMRGIQVLRGGRIVGVIDVYRMLKGSGSDIGLQAGDVIYIPGYFNRVAVRGEVRHQAIFELRDDESLADLLSYAQVKPSGVTQRVLVSTVDPGSTRLLKDVDVDDPGQAGEVKLYDGASVEVFSVRQDIANKVTIEGAVDQPGEYALTPGMTVADLVASARGVLDETYTSHADLYRYNADTTLTHIPIDLDKALKGDPTANIPLTRWDKLRVYSRSEVEFIGRRDVTVRGAVQHQGIYYRSDNLRVKDLLLQAGGTIPDAYLYRATLLHQRPDGSYKYEFVDLDAAMKDDPDNNVLLEDHDVLAVYTVEEAQFVPQHTIAVEGEVVTPGKNYPRGDGMHLSDALKIAGGPTPKAGDLIQVAHARTDQGSLPIDIEYSPQTGEVDPDPLLQDGDVITLPGRGNFQEKPLVVTVSGAVNRPGPVILSGPQVRLSDVIKLAGGLKPEAYPQGAEFTRDPANMQTADQTRLALLISHINNILNDSEYQRALALSDLERIKELGSALQGQQQISIPGITPQQLPSQLPSNGANGLFNRDLVSPPRRMTMADLESSGNIAVNLAVALKHPGSDEDIILKDGDAITVPEKPTTVEIVGAVIHPQGVVYHDGEPMQYYIDRAGGYAPDAAKDRVLVIHIGGGLIPAKTVREIEPGDVILVPSGVLAAKLAQHTSEFDEIFKTLANTALIAFVAARIL